MHVVGVCVLIKWCKSLRHKFEIVNIGMLNALCRFMCIVTCLDGGEDELL